MSNDFSEQRKRLVESLKRNGYIKSKTVEEAMLKVPRELFVPESSRHMAYNDHPISTYEGQTISAPHMNAMMCELLKLKPGQKVLEIGTGSGYHAALCAVIVGKPDENGRVGHVYTVERIPKLVKFARENIRKAGLEDLITVIEGDGTLGYPEKAPYDRILVTAAGPEIPPPLIEQLKTGGLLCIPVGTRVMGQKLVLVEKTENKIKKYNICGVVFVPLIGKYGY